MLRGLFATLFLLNLTFSVYSQGYNNRWSLEFSAGATNAVKPYTPGYWSNTVGFFHTALGTRFMFNNKYGLMLDAGYDRITEDNISWFTNTGNSLDFTSHYGRGSLQVVMDVGRVLQFENFSEKVSFLFHTGGGMSILASKVNPEVDRMVNFTFGAGPQFKVNERLSINLDASFIWHIYQQYTFDMNSSVAKRGFDGFIANASVGMSIYLGKYATHMDWAFSPCFPDMSYLEVENKKLDSTNQQLRTNLRDDDGDGVPNFMDKENNTTYGSVVDNQGVSLKNKDTDGDGVMDLFDKCPDIPGTQELEGCPQDLLTAIKNNDPKRISLNNDGNNLANNDGNQGNNGGNQGNNGSNQGNNGGNNGNNGSNQGNNGSNQGNNGGNQGNNGGNQGNNSGNQGNNGGNQGNNGGNQGNNGGNQGNNSGNQGNNGSSQGNNGSNQGNNGGNQGNNGSNQGNNGGNQGNNGNNGSNQGTNGNNSNNNNSSNPNNNPPSTEGLVNLVDIHFVLNSAAVDPSVYPILKEVAALLKAHPGSSIVLDGHTDATGEDDFNEILSKKRAEAIRKYIMAQGVPPESVQLGSFGEKKPKFLNTTPKGRELNRRVEIYFKI